MLDKLSRKILKYMKNHPNIGDTNFNAGVFGIAEGISTNQQQVRDAIHYLETSGLIAYRRNGKGQIVGFRLSHLGQHNTEFTIRNLLENWLDRIVSFILGVVATIVAQMVIEWLSK